MTKEQNCRSDKEKLDSIAKNIENVEAGLTGLPLFYQNVKAIVQEYIYLGGKH